MQIRRSAAALAATAALGLGGVAVAAPASAATAQNGLVNVAIDNVNILNGNAVGIGVAANVIAQVCGVAVPVNVLAQAVTQGNTFQTLCAAQGNAPVAVTPTVR
jgi:hypothetical protein